jgi:lycopene cyclase domain-containing protein
VTTYLLLAAGVAVPLSAVALVVLARAGRRVLVPALIGLVVLVALTAVFDNVIVGTGIVAYDGSRILGLRIGVAPIEDFSYCVVAALALPALWVLLGRRGRAR